MDFCGSISLYKVNQSVKRKHASELNAKGAKQDLKYLFLTLPNSDSSCALPKVPVETRKNFVLLQWHGNAFVMFQRFHINTITTIMII